MRIETDRLYLRPLTDEDCSDEYVSWLNDPLVNRFLETRHVAQNMDTVREFVKRVSDRDDEHLLGMFLRQSDRHIGNIKLGPIMKYHPVADVSLLIGARDCWGQGYATETIDALSRHAFKTWGLRKLSAGMYAANQASCRAFLKVGYQQEARRRAHYLLDDEMSDIIELGLTPQDLAPK
jgi:RimJ/RimL family protein N-acetyltransferase